jgi:hypothetical protein
MRGGIRCLVMHAEQTGAAWRSGSARSYPTPSPTRTRQETPSRPRLTVRRGAAAVQHHLARAVTGRSTLPTRCKRAVTGRIWAHDYSWRRRARQASAELAPTADSGASSWLGFLVVDRYRTTGYVWRPVRRAMCGHEEAPAAGAGLPAAIGLGFGTGT